jgi:hypothetical protein
MKPLCYLTLFLLVSSTLQAQKKAVTETGEQVMLYDNGTWRYVSDSSSVKEDTVFSMNPRAFEKNKDASFLVKSTQVPEFGFLIDPKKWDFKKRDGNPIEYSFKLKEEDLFAMVITEKIMIPVTDLSNIALENAQKASSDIKIIRREYRMVNGIKVLNMEMRGTVQGIKIVYFGYYFSNDKGTLQFLTYCGESVWEGYKETSEKLLDGLVLLKEEPTK